MASFCVFVVITNVVIIAIARIIDAIEPNSGITAVPMTITSSEVSSSGMVSLVPSSVDSESKFVICVLSTQTEAGFVINFSGKSIISSSACPKPESVKVMVLLKMK